MAKKKTGPFSVELLDSLLSGRDPKTILDSGRLIGDLKKALAERILNAEMDVHLGSDEEAGAGNHRNGSSAKTVLTPEVPMEPSIPRDRHDEPGPSTQRSRTHRRSSMPNTSCAASARSAAGIAPSRIKLWSSRRIPVRIDWP